MDSFHTCYFLILRKITQLDLVQEVTMLSSHFMLQAVILASQTRSVPEGLDHQDVFRGKHFSV